MNRRVTMLAIAAAMVSGGALVACAPTAQLQVQGQPLPSVQAAPVVSQENQVPEPLQVPAGNKLVSSLDGSGVQIYECTNNSWTLLEPAATLSEKGKPVVLHFKGPIWVSTVDGSEVGAAQVPGATVKHDDAVPELLLKATEHQGQGVLDKVTFVQRLQTKGGLAPTGLCVNGVQRAVPYSAVYQFWAPA